MKNTYFIKGMSCNGCRSHVESILSKVEGVQDASVNLGEATATLESQDHLPFEVLEQALAEEGNLYTIHLEKPTLSEEKKSLQ